MKPALSPWLAACILLVGGSQAAAQHVYPSKGQSAKKQAKDESECSRWATNKTGFDPANPPEPAQVEPAGVTGSGARARGALAGAAIGGISGGDAVEGAVAGAAVGGIARRSKNRRAARAQNEATARHLGAQHDSYLQARSACLSGRGYSVK